MRTFTLVFNHNINHNGFVIKAYDMQEAIQEAIQAKREGWNINAIKTELGKIYTL